MNENRSLLARSNSCWCPWISGWGVFYHTMSGDRLRRKRIWLRGRMITGAMTGAIHGWVGLAEPGWPTFQLFGFFFSEFAVCPWKGRPTKGKKQSSFLKGYVTLLGTSMAAEKESSEDDYDGMWTGSLGCCCCGVCVCVETLLKRPCWTHQCFVFIPILGYIRFKLNSITMTDLTDWRDF